MDLLLKNITTLHWKTEIYGLLHPLKPDDLKGIQMYSLNQSF